MKTRLLLLGVYLVLTPMFVLVLIFYQLFLYHQNSNVSGKVLAAATSNVAYNAVPDSPGNSRITVNAHEARVDVLAEFFGRYDSPLREFAGQIVDAADKYSLDYRLLPAIAMQESTLCQKIPKDSYNCWGFGIYGGKVTRFGSFPEAIETISKTLAQSYHQNGLNKPSEIMSRYTPSNTGDWAGNVTYVMDRIGAAL
jgi:hypothetical protein